MIIKIRLFHEEEEEKRTKINLESSIQDFALSKEQPRKIKFHYIWEHFPNISLTIQNNNRYIAEQSIS